MNDVSFTFSDLIAGYVTRYDAATDAVFVKTTDGREFSVGLTDTTYAELVRNLGEGYQDATSQLRELLVPGRFLFAYGVLYPESQNRFEAKHLVFLGRTENEFRFEKQDWWIRQVRQLADFYLNAEFGESEIDFSQYTTDLDLDGNKGARVRQETDTISRLVYGFASAFLMTGEDRYLEAAAKGTEYLRKHFRFEDKSEDICYWYHAIDLKRDGTVSKVFASEFGDDFDAIPCYEQIYALAGPTQTYRITGDPRILSDVRGTINLFNRFFRDKGPHGGFFSHIDPITLSPTSDSLGPNRARKNWNSVGDHAPAYLINLFLATGQKEHADFLESTFDTISARFPDYDHSPFVNERFFEDWSFDQNWKWQQNRAVVGHNLKICWNLMRMQNLRPKDEYVALARKIAKVMPTVGMDRQRGGWYDVMERALQPGQRFHRFSFHDRKAWWQQEQAILAYSILAGTLKDPAYRRLARESAAFYNAFFLDTQQGGVYFNVLASGIPFLVGSERGKGSHSMSGYHSFELAYLAAVYTNLLVTREPMDFFFKPQQGGFADGVLRVAPDLLPPGSVRIGEVWINGVRHTDFDAEKLTVKLPANHGEIKVRVRLVPVDVTFSADLLDVADGTAKIALAGSFSPAGIRFFEQAFESARSQGATAVQIILDDLGDISTEAVRFLVFTRQKLGSSFPISAVGANDSVKQALEESEFEEELVMVG